MKKNIDKIDTYDKWWQPTMKREIIGEDFSVLKIMLTSAVILRTKIFKVCDMRFYILYSHAFRAIWKSCKNDQTNVCILVCKNFEVCSISAEDGCYILFSKTVFIGVYIVLRSTSAILNFLPLLVPLTSFQIFLCFMLPNITLKLPVTLNNISIISIKCCDGYSGLCKYVLHNM